MTITEPTVDDLAQLCFALAIEEAYEIMGGEDHITLDDMTACELVAMLTIIRPAWERRRLAQRQPAPVLKLVRGPSGDNLTDRDVSDRGAALVDPASHDR
jgi:hypothetical protein